MIESVHIRNFECHEATDIEFHEGVNVIVGSSDGGKSSILRALYWLIFNRPSGDEFRSDWGGDTMVSGIFSDKDKSVTVHRFRSKSENKYVMGTTEFKAMNRDVPDEIQDAINIKHVNVQRQFDAPYLLSSSSADVARHFNRVAKLDDIDQSMSRISSLSRENKQARRQLEDDSERLKLELEAYADIDEREKDISNIESILQQLADLKDKSSSISHIISLCSNVSERLIPIDKLLEAEDSVRKLSEEAKLIEDKRLDVMEINRLGKSINQINKKIKSCDCLIESECEVKALNKKTLEIDKTERNRSIELGLVITDIELLEENIAQYEFTIKHNQSKLPNTCPTCGGEMHNGQKKT